MLEINKAKPQGVPTGEHTAQADAGQQDAGFANSPLFGFHNGSIS